MKKGMVEIGRCGPGFEGPSESKCASRGRLNFFERSEESVKACWRTNNRSEGPRGIGIERDDEEGMLLGERR